MPVRVMYQANSGRTLMGIATADSGGAVGGVCEISAAEIGPGNVMGCAEVRADEVSLAACRRSEVPIARGAERSIDMPAKCWSGAHSTGATAHAAQVAGHLHGSRVRSAKVSTSRAKIRSRVSRRTARAAPHCSARSEISSRVSTAARTESTSMAAEGLSPRKSTGMAAAVCCAARMSSTPYVRADMTAASVPTATRSSAAAAAMSTPMRSSKHGRRQDRNGRQQHGKTCLQADHVATPHARNSMHAAVTSDPCEELHNFVMQF
jgi:hypothetical protein